MDLDHIFRIVLVVGVVLILPYRTYMQRTGRFLPRLST